MRQLLLLIGVLSTSTTVSSKGICHACFDEICYTKSSVFKKHPVTGQLGIDRVENVVYFHYEDPILSDQTVAFDLDDIRFLTIPDLQFSFARTVDQDTREVYIGGASGIYKYNPFSNTTNLYGLHDKIIWHMQFKDVLYYTVLMTKGLYTYDKKQSKSIHALSDFNIDDFIVDKRNDIYFMSNYTMYKLKKGDKKPTVFSNIIYSLSTDIYDNAYFVQRESRGLYKVDYRTGRIIEIGAFANGSPFRFVFDRFNNVIYYDATTGKLYYLVPNYGMCKVKTEGIGRTLRKMVAPIV